MKRKASLLRIEIAGNSEGTLPGYFFLTEYFLFSILPLILF